MRHKSKERMDKIVQIIEYWKLKEGINPTIAQIAADAGMPASRVHAYLQEMNENGIIEYSYRHFSTGKTEKINAEKNTAAVVGSVKCGDPQLEESEILEYVQLPVSIFGKKDMYILKANGDSMVDAGIDEGDYIVVENTNSAKKNDIVVALTTDGENTLKRFSGIDKNGQAILKYENEEQYPNKTIKLDQMRIQGIARFIIKEI